MEALMWIFFILWNIAGLMNMNWIMYSVENKFLRFFLYCLTGPIAFCLYYGFLWLESIQRQLREK